MRICRVFLFCLMTWPAFAVERGELASYSNLFENGISASIVDLYLTAYQMGELTPAQYDVAICRITYWTLDAMGPGPALASGAVQIPLLNGAPLTSPLPLLIYAHGTESYRWNVPSCPHNSPSGPYSPFRLLNLATVNGLPFSSAGYYVFLPDYAGLGFDTTSLVTPYLIADREPIAVLDGLRAAQQLAAQFNLRLNGRLFLAGYSQGGHVCLATHRMLEEEYGSEFRVTAAGPGGAPADLSGSMTAALNNGRHSGNSFVAFAIAAFQPRFSIWQNFDEVFRPAYTDVPGLFYGAQNDLGTISAQLPDTAAEMLTAAIIQQARDPTSAFFKTVASNNVYQWKPLCPLTLFYAGADTTVLPANSITAYAAMRSLGADVELLNVGHELDHSTGFPRTQLGILSFFDRYRHTVSAAASADYDGDQAADPAQYDSLTGALTVKLSGSGNEEVIFYDCGGSNYTALAADFDGDRKADPAAIDGIIGGWKAQLSGSEYAPVSLEQFGALNYPLLAADFDGDRRADPACYQPNSAPAWIVLFSNAGYSSATLWSGFGGPTYLPLAADIDGDHKADPVIYETTTGEWQARLSAGNYRVESIYGLGGTGYVALLADFDGDARADPAVYRESDGGWYACLSASGYTLASIGGFGGTGYTALAADFDGDRKADPAVWQASAAILAIKLSGRGYAQSTISF